MNSRAIAIATRWPDRDRDARERDVDPRDVFTRDLHLLRGLEREIVRDRDREYTLRGSESRTLATVGAFRVVSTRDLRDQHDRPPDPRSGDLRHLREQGLIETVRVPGYRDHAVVLTKEGRNLLENHRDRDHGHQQTFYAGLKRERELEHARTRRPSTGQTALRIVRHVPSTLTWAAKASSTTRTTRRVRQRSGPRRKSTRKKRSRSRLSAPATLRTRRR